MLHPYLIRRFQTNDLHLRYRRLQHNVFDDTLLARTKFKRGKKYAEIFVTKFGWSCEFPMAKNRDTRGSLSLLFQWDGVTPKTIVDISKEQPLGVFKHKVVEAGCHLRQKEPESTCQMDSKGVICELTRGSGRKMTKMKPPKVIWGDFLELEAYIRSNTALDIFRSGWDDF